MSPSLASPQPAPVAMPPVRPTSYRCWEDYRADELRAVLDKIALVIDDKRRQLDLIAASKQAAPAAPGPSVPAATPTTKNETLGEILSPSQANTFLNCSAKWWFKYGAGLPDPKGGSLVRGLAVHKTIERWFKLILENVAPDIEDMREPYDDAWDALSADASFAADDDIDELKRSGAVLLRKYLEEVAPEIRPATLEQQVIGEIGGVKVRGYIDIVDVDGRIIDVKTAAKSPSGIAGDYAFQLATYRQLLPTANGKARLDTLVATKTPKLVKIEYEVTAADQLLTTNLYPRVREGIREGLYFPNRNSNLCSRKYATSRERAARSSGDASSESVLSPSARRRPLCRGRHQQGGATLKRAAIYVRVSTTNRTRTGDGFEQNPEVQELPLRQMVEQRGWTLARVYSDRLSGSKENRPGLNSLMKDATRGQFDVVLVWRFDRFARSIEQLVRALAEFRALGIDFVSCQEALDTSTPMGKAMFTIIGAMAELERNVIRERVLAGMEYARRHGTKSGNAIGRPRRIFDRGEVVRLRESGLSIEKIAGQMRVGVGTVVRVLHVRDLGEAAFQNP